MASLLVSITPAESSLGKSHFARPNCGAAPHVQKVACSTFKPLSIPRANHSSSRRSRSAFRDSRTGSSRQGRPTTPSTWTHCHRGSHPLAPISALRPVAQRRLVRESPLALVQRARKKPCGFCFSEWIRHRRPVEDDFSQPGSSSFCRVFGRLDQSRSQNVGVGNRLVYHRYPLPCADFGNRKSLSTHNEQRRRNTYVCRARNRSARTGRIARQMFCGSTAFAMSFHGRLQHSGGLAIERATGIGNMVRTQDHHPCAGWT